MQALEFIAADFEIRSGELIDGRQRLRIVGGELGEDGVWRRQQFPRASGVGDVGVDLASVNGEVRQSIDLRPLDLSVPIGALDQPDHDASLAAAGEIDDPVDHEGAALAVALHHEAQAVPFRKFGVERQAFEQIERQLQSVGLLGIDIEADVITFGEQRELAHTRQQFAHDAVALRGRSAGEAPKA